MLRTALHAIVVSSFTLMLWLVARPAYATLATPAPLCDDRGATAVAPPVELEGPEGAIERAKAPVSCPRGGRDWDVAWAVWIAQGHGRGVASSSMAEPVLPASQTDTVAPPGEMLEPPSMAMAAAEGVRGRVERPPRG